MLIITRSVVAAAVIVGTVVLSLGASFGLSVLIWQHILGIELHWMVLAMAVIILLAVGADYNLLLVARLKEEIPAGINTGIIRAMGGSGSVVTSAGLVFAFTMMSFAISELKVLAQVGTTIGAGPAVRHPGGPSVHDAVDRRTARPMVLVAADMSGPGRCRSRGRRRARNPSRTRPSSFRWARALKKTRHDDSGPDTLCSAHVRLPFADRQLRTGLCCHS